MTTTRELAVLLIAIGALLSCVAPSSLAAADPPKKTEPASDKKGDTEEKPETEKKEQKKKQEEDRYLAIQNGTVHTVTGPQLNNVTIVCKNGKIHQIGRSLSVPKAAQVVDAANLHVYPGLIALSSSRLVGSGEPSDSTDVFSLPMVMGLAGGLTTVVSGNHAVKLTHGSLDGIVLKRNVFESISITSSASRRKFREALDRVRKHLREVEIYEEKKRRKVKDAKKPDEKWIKGDYQKAMRLIKREAVGRAQANDVGRLRRLVQLSEDYGIEMVIEGAAEAWTTPAEVSRARISAIVTPRARVDRDPLLVRANGSSIENASVLHRHGVPIGILPEGRYISTGGLAGQDLLHLPMEAAFAVRGGLPEQAALEAITIGPARMMRMDHRVGSIEVAKDADLIITDGPLLRYTTHVRWSIVNGRIAYDKQKDSLFSHIRPEGEADAPPPDDHWPRSLGEPW